MSEALHELVRLIRIGAEYPEAEWIVVNRLKVSATDLRDEYDRWCVSYSSSDDGEVN